MFQHIKASFDYEDYMVGKWPVELSGVTDTQVQWITRLLPVDMVLNTVACVQTGGSCSSHQPEGPGLSQPHVWELRRPRLPRETRSLGSLAL